MKMKLLWSAVVLMFVGAAQAQPSAHARLNAGIRPVPLTLLGEATPVMTAPAPQPEAPQVKDDLLAGTEKFAQGASDVSDVDLDGHMLGMLGHKEGKKGDLAAKLDFIVVRSYTYDKPGMYRMEDVEAYSKKLTDGSWSCFVHVRERKSGEATDICARQAADHETNELVIITAEPKELTFVHLKGRMSLEDLKGMSHSAGAGLSVR